MTDAAPAPEDGLPTNPVNGGGTRSGERHWLDNVAVLAASAAAVGAAVVAGVGVWQACIARDTEERQIRAYVFLKDIWLDKRNDDVFDIIPEWENTGNSQTSDMHAFINRIMTNVTVPSWVVYGDIEGIPSLPIVLGPKSVSGVTFMQIDRRCLDQFNNRVNMDKFWIWGHAKYNDILTNKPHITRFCWDVQQIVYSDNGRSARLSYALCEKGNCSDDECPPEQGTEKREFAMPQSTCTPPKSP
jgi:hypothetical protein